MSWTTLSMMNASLEKIKSPYYTDPNYSGYYLFRNLFPIIITVLVICVLGAVGNGVVIWLLVFRIKRNPFMTYILNLAVADFGVVLFDFVIIFMFSEFIPYSDIRVNVNLPLFLLMYSASQFLLMAISIDRCVAVFLPLWYQCKRPPHLSTIVCAVIWVLSFLLSAITYAINTVNVNVIRIENFYQFIVNAVVCLPAMMVATVSLFIKACLKSRQPQRGRLLTIILLTLLFFLLCAFPYNIIFILKASDYLEEYEYMPAYAFLLACLNSSVNPVIYFLVGRQWKSRRRENLKMILQNVFKEEEGRAEETPRT
ncbi:mas-related G-protein coupled receptor member H-like [Paroedura picta]|uniref:mas-related G-protein coupled receptor member H-like n=1 Tax=Paroedura picta TaxID=143630 RepID=UPI004056B07F